MNKELRLCCGIQWYPQVTNIFKLDLMPNFSMIEKVVQQECAIDYLVSKYTFLLINQFIQRQNIVIDEDILWHMPQDIFINLTVYIFVPSLNNNTIFIFSSYFIKHMLASFFKFLCICATKSLHLGIYAS